MAATFIQCNGAPVLKMRLHAPIGSGAWTADLEASREESLTGAVTISDGVNAWRGTALRSGVVAGLCSAIVVGGRGGLRKVVSAKSYTGAVARTIVQDILNEAGETLAQAAITAPELRTVLTAWSRLSGDEVEGTAGAQLTSLLEAVGATWRVLPDGSVWVGSPKFVRATPKGLVEIDREPSRQRVHVALDALDLLPDTTLKTDRVGDVEYRVDPNGLAATYWLEAA